jgi:ADP-ribosylglycohydrolase
MSEPCAVSVTSRIYGCLFGSLIGDAMGAPVEGKTYQEIAATHGEVSTFDGTGTDDTAIRLILIDAIVASGGHPRIDDFAQSFMRARTSSYDLWWVPVKNMFHKLEAGVTLPVDAGWGNMHSSSSAMAIAPLGILNAGDPLRAARETFEIASLIHSGPSGFARDAACAMAAAVAAAFVPAATVESVLAAATAFLLPRSAREMRAAIHGALDLAAFSKDYETFRAAYYEQHLREIVADPRETVPVALALFRLAHGDPNRAIVLGANFGRDADTIATMAGGLAGAFQGLEMLNPRWVEQVKERTGIAYDQTVEYFRVALAQRSREEHAHARLIDDLLGTG